MSNVAHDFGSLLGGMYTYSKSIALSARESSVEPTRSIQSTQSIPPIDTPEIEPTAERLTTEDHAFPDARIRIATTSDWTVFRLANGAILDDIQILSSSSEVDTASFDQDQFVSIQPISQAEAGISVELVADLCIREGTFSENLEFEIDRGYIGATTVEIFSYVCDKPILIDTFT